MRANSSNKAAAPHASQLITEKRPAASNRTELEETKRPWPPTNYQLLPTSAPEPSLPPLQLSAASLPTLPDVAIQIPAAAPAGLPAPHPHVLPDDDDSLRSIIEFLDLAEVLSFSRTSTRNNAFVRATVPQVQIAREEHRVQMERYHSATRRDRLAILMAIAAGGSFVGGQIATVIYTVVRAGGGTTDAGDAAIGMEAAVPLTLALGYIARRSASRMRQAQHVPASPREALAQARHRFEADRDSRRQDLEANRALAQGPAWRDDADGTLKA